MSKRAFDILFSFLLLTVLFPFLIIIAILIKLNSNGPAIFKQQRVGINNKYFTIYKFRTMTVNAPNIASDKVNQDEYSTMIGRVLRNSSIDELPQLYNILVGDMSFVGPRPALYNQYTLINQRTLNGVHKIKPGLTGFAQVNGRDNLLDTQKVEFDKYYLRNKSNRLDFIILMLTFAEVFGITINRKKMSN